MKFETQLDRRIFKTIQGCAPTKPQTLVGIISGVDASERLVLTHDELSGGLQRLVIAGYVTEIERHRFYDATLSKGANTFSGITEFDHANALEEYRDWFRRQSDDILSNPSADDFVWLKLVLRWTTPDERWPNNDDEDGAEELAKVIDPIIKQSGLGEINGFEHGRGHIDVLIFGKRTDSDVEQIYELLAPHFRAFKCPAGSRIIRVYNQQNEVNESDIVPGTAT